TYTQLELHKDGARFRYGGRWLVPLDSGEPTITESRLDQGGIKARAVVTQVAKRPSPSRVARADTLRFLVVIDPHGRVRESHLVGGPIRSAWEQGEWLAAGRAALARWQFEPARASGQAVSDWLMVDVPVSQVK